MKRKILLLAFLGLFGSVNANNYDPELPFVVTNTADVLKGDYDKYGEKLGTKFKGTEDLKLLKEIVSWLGTHINTPLPTREKALTVRALSQAFTTMSTT